MTTSSLPTYEERIERYRIARREANMSEERRADYRLNGIDPDDTWALIWSFRDRDAAEQQLQQERKQLADRGYAHLYEYRLIDAGKAETITRQAWL